MKVVGKIVGVLSGYYFLDSWWAIFAGLLLGHLVDKRREIASAKAISNLYDWSVVKIIQDDTHFKLNQNLVVSYCQALFIVLGRMAKLDGLISKEQIDWVERLMSDMNISGPLREKCIELFRSGKQLDRDIAAPLSALYWQVHPYQDIKERFVEVLVEAIYVGDHFNRPGWLLILEVAAKLNYPEAKLWRLRHQYEDRLAKANSEAGRSRQKAHQESGRRQTEQRRQRKKSTSESAADDRSTGSSYSKAYSNYKRYWSRSGVVNSTDNLTDKQALATLGISYSQWQSFNKKALKKVYRKLMSKHHPDKLTAAGASTAEIEAAKARTQSIRAAYDRLNMRL